MKSLYRQNKKIAYGLAAIAAVFLVANGGETLNSDKVLAKAQQVSKKQKISSDEAIQIALNEARLKKEEVKGLKVELKRDDDWDNREIYEVEFTHQDQEYNVVVDALTKKVLYYEKEQKDD